MTRARPTPLAPTKGKPKPADDIEPALEPPRKRPWLLAWSVALLTAWLALLAGLAWRG